MYLDHIQGLLRLDTGTLSLMKTAYGEENSLKAKYEDATFAKSSQVSRSLVCKLDARYLTSCRMLDVLDVPVQTKINSPQ